MSVGCNVLSYFLSCLPDLLQLEKNKGSIPSIFDKVYFCERQIRFTGIADVCDFSAQCGMV